MWLISRLLAHIAANCTSALIPDLAPTACWRTWYDVDLASCKQVVVLPRQHRVDRQQQHQVGQPQQPRVGQQPRQHQVVPHQQRQAERQRQPTAGVAVSRR